MTRKTIDGAAVLRTPLAAKYIDRAPSTLEKWRTYGGGPVFVTQGTAVGYLIDDLDDWLDRNRSESTSSRYPKSRQTAPPEGRAAKQPRSGTDVHDQPRR